ncbi:hypothetical protein FA13DRAFT_1834783 [Coprinellus micaceus]|uniref:Uncharacterized protein n=1 Tax=Coprinellus micaceus TaxID=71717 RepID=A0A4Y7SHG2_COPMI|nr:hypothetical protein FA13DRAFT_1834783 [Coprinellus micaceus]
MPSGTERIGGQHCVSTAVLDTFSEPVGKPQADSMNARILDRDPRIAALERDVSIEGQKGKAQGFFNRRSNSDNNGKGLPNWPEAFGDRRRSSNRGPNPVVPPMRGRSPSSPHLVSEPLERLYGPTWGSGFPHELAWLRLQRFKDKAWVSYTAHSDSLGSEADLISACPLRAGFVLSPRAATKEISQTLPSRTTNVGTALHPRGAMGTVISPGEGCATEFATFPTLASRPLILSDACIALRFLRYLTAADCTTRSRPTGLVELSGVCPVDQAAQFAPSGSVVPVLLSIDLLSLDRGSPLYALLGGTPRAIRYLTVRHPHNGKYLPAACNVKLVLASLPGFIWRSPSSEE